MTIKFDEIKLLKVHWSENQHINDVMGHDENYDIEKEVSPAHFEKIIKDCGAPGANGGYDKTSMTVVKVDGTIWAKECKFYLKSGDTLETLLNSER